MSTRYNSGEAYDFDLFQPKRSLEQPNKEPDNIIRIPKEELKKNRKVSLRPLKVAAMVTFLLLMLGIVGTMVYGQVRLTELTENINTASKQLNESQSLYTQLQMKLNAKLSLDTVENYAENTLGMRKIQSNQVEYITLAEGDKGHVEDKKQEPSWLDSIYSYVQGLLS